MPALGPAPAHERFIHDAMIRFVEDGLEAVYDMWKKNKHVAPFLLSWPGEIVTAHDGVLVEGIVTFDLPEDKKEDWPRMMRKTVSLTKSYGLMLCEQRQDDVHLLLESGHGTKSWTLPIKRSGDVLLLGKPETTIDVENFGLLWTPRQRAQA